MLEVYKDIKNYEGYYQVGNLGNVRSLDRIVPHKTKGFLKLKSRILKPSFSRDGYKKVVLQKEGMVRYFRINRLVADAFIPNPENKPCVNHKDGDKLNNNVDNLEWNTVQENNDHAWKIGLFGESTINKMKKNNSGEGNPSHKLTKENVLNIRELHSNGMLQKDIAIKYSLNSSTVSSIVNNKSWK